MLDPIRTIEADGVFCLACGVLMSDADCALGICANGHAGRPAMRAYRAPSNARKAFVRSRVGAWDSVIVVPSAGLTIRTARVGRFYLLDSQGSDVPLYRLTSRVAADAARDYVRFSALARIEHSAQACNRFAGLADSAMRSLLTAMTGA